MQNEEWSKVQQVQELAEASFKERRKMIAAAGKFDEAQHGDGKITPTAGEQDKSKLLMEELVADLNQLQSSLQAEQKRQRIIYQRKLLERVQRKKKRILNTAAEEQKTLEKAALQHQTQLLSQEIQKQQFLFCRTKTQQV